MIVKKPLITASWIRVKTTAIAVAETAPIIVNAQLNSTVTEFAIIDIEFGFHWLEMLTLDFIFSKASPVNKTWMNASRIRARTTPPVTIYRDHSPASVHLVSRVNEKKADNIFSLLLLLPNTL